MFLVEGVVEKADGSTLYLEKRGLMETSILDSVKLDASGEFSFKSLVPEHVEFYLLRLGNNQVINFAVDTIETIKITASKDDFSRGYKIEGSPRSAQMKEVVLLQYDLNKNIAELKKQYESKALTSNEYLEKLSESIDNYKSNIQKIIMSDLKSPAAYFALFQKIDGYLIFDPYQKSDSKMYSAVATSWDFNYKDTPRARHLKEFTLKAIKERRSVERKNSMIENAQETNPADFYNIELPDVSGKIVSLESFKGKIVLLDFTTYQAEFSPMHNVAINKVYEKLKSDMVVYQVAFDRDMHFWQNAAANLPWIAVRDPQSVSSSLIYRFNIEELPTIFLLNREGELVKRLAPQDNIEAEIRKLL